MALQPRLQAEISAHIHALYATGAAESNRWLGQLREKLTWVQAASLWEGVVKSDSEVVRFCLAVLVAAKAGECPAEEARTWWLVESAEAELLRSGDAAARRIAVAAVDATLQEPSLFAAAVARWIRETRNGSMTPAVAIALLRFAAEQGQQIACNEDTCELQVVCARNRAIEPCRFPACGVPATTATAARRAICEVAAASVELLLELCSPSKTSNHGIRTEALRGLESWLTAAASINDSKATVSTVELLNMRVVLLDSAIAASVLAQVGNNGSEPVVSACLVSSIADLVCQRITQTRTIGAACGEPAMTHTIACRLERLASEWSKSFGDRPQDSGAVASAIAWCGFMVSLAPLLLELGSRDELVVCLLRLTSSQGWPTDVREASLEPWSTLLNSISTDCVDPRITSHIFQVTQDLQQLHVNVARALMLGLRYTPDATEWEELDRFRDRAVALNIEFRMVLRSDPLPQVIEESLVSSGVFEWQAVEATFFLVSTAAPQILRKRQASELSLLANVILRIGDSLRIPIPNDLSATRLRVSASTLLRKASGIFIKGAFHEQMQQQLLLLSTESLASEAFVAPSIRILRDNSQNRPDIRRSAEDALRFGAVALSALVRDGAWLAPSSACACLTRHLGNGIWLPSANELFVRTYCGVLGGLPPEDFEPLLRQLWDRMLALASLECTVSDLALRLLLSILRTLPTASNSKSPLDRQGRSAHPLRFQLFAEAWGIVERAILTQTNQQRDDLLSDVITLICTHSEEQIVRNHWMPTVSALLLRLDAELLTALPALPLLRAVTALVETFRDDDGCTKAALSTLTCAFIGGARINDLNPTLDHTIRPDRADVSRISALFDLADMVSFSGLLAQDEALALAILGLSAMPLTSSPEACRSIVAHATNLYQTFQPGCTKTSLAVSILGSILRTLLCSPAARNDRSLATSFARRAWDTFTQSGMELRVVEGISAFAAEIGPCPVADFLEALGVIVSTGGGSCENVLYRLADVTFIAQGFSRLAQLHQPSVFHGTTVRGAQHARSEQQPKN